MGSHPLHYDQTVIREHYTPSSWLPTIKRSKVLRRQRLWVFDIVADQDNGAFALALATVRAGADLPVSTEYRNSHLRRGRFLNAPCLKLFATQIGGKIVKVMAFNHPLLSYDSVVIQSVVMMPSRHAGDGRANDTDRHVGTRIRERRIMLGFGQQKMADLIGVTYQQAHKYERGINRISAGRLYEIGKVFGVPVDYFFEGLEAQSAPDLTKRQRLCLELARNFAAITNEKHQAAVAQMARALAGEGK